MGRKSRLIALILLLAVASTFVLSACSSTPASSSAPAAPASSAAPAASSTAPAAPASSAAPASPAGDFPNKPITLILPFGAGGSHDAHARLIERVAPKYLNGQPLIIELKPGGSGAIGSAYGARAVADGYTLTFGSNGCLTVLPIAEDVPFTKDDFIPISQINYSPSLIVTDSKHWKTVDELIADAAANPGKISFASSGMFNSGHMAMEVFQKNSGLVFNHIPMEGSEPQLTVLGGQVELCGAFADEIIDLAADGSLVPLVVSAKERIKAYPDVPSFGDLGYDMEWNMWRAIFAPKGTAPEIIEYLDNAFKGICTDPEFIDMVEKMGEEVYYMNRTDFAKFWDDEYAYFEEMFSQ